MRYGSDHKKATRQRIVESAGRRLKRDGIDGTGVATLMADANLTNGAFYGHFQSKEDLVAAALVGELREQRQTLRDLARGREGIEQVIREYLSAEHRDNAESGCPSAALLEEIGRRPETTRQAYTDGVYAIIDDLGVRLASIEPQSLRTQLLSVFGLMVGTIQIARAIVDPVMADALLEQGVGDALRLLGINPDGSGGAKLT